MSVQSKSDKHREPDFIVPNSWAHLLDLLYEGSWNHEIERFRSPLAFRGMSIAAVGLSHSLHRLTQREEVIERMELHLLRNFRKYAHAHAVPTETVWNWLALAQHHNLPTRLLDWTYSPFVALHFATQEIEDFDHDGMIWCVDYVRSKACLPQSLRKALEREGGDVFTAEILSTVAGSLSELRELDQHDFAVFLEPPSLDDRIVNQYALFSLMSRADAHMDDWLEEHPELLRKVLLPKELKWEVRDKLDQANINERTLFPGLDGLSRWLRRHYTPKHLEREIAMTTTSSPIDGEEVA